MIESGATPVAVLKPASPVHDRPLSDSIALAEAHSNELGYVPGMDAEFAADIEEIIRKHHAEHGECYFWAVHSQAELDLLIFKNGKRLGFEIKYSDAPRLSKSMITAYETLH